MKYRIHQIKLNINEPIENITDKIAREVNQKDLKIMNYSLIKESIDARDKGDIKLVYSVDFEVADDIKLKLDEAPDMSYKQVNSGAANMENRPVIVGFGPAGMFAGLILAMQGYKPLIIERGNSVDQRIKDVKEFWEKGILNENSNVQFGEGGAGTFSDGKLTTGIKDPRARKVIEEMVEASAPSDILFKQKAHIGTDVLRVVVSNIREKIIRFGGEIRFGNRLVELITKDDQICGIKVCKENNEIIEIATENLILAIGHSARDTFRTLNASGVKMIQKPFSIGVRIEHPQELIDRAQYGNAVGLPEADYKLSYHCKNGRGVYTFCMCPGGEVIVAASQMESVAINGMSNRKRDSGKANSGLLCDVKVTDFGSEEPLAGIDFQEKYEKLAFINGGKNYNAPKTTWEAFSKRRESALPVINSLPDFAVEAITEAVPNLGRRLKGFDNRQAVIYGVETRSSSPVRIVRDDNGEGSFKGLYPIGEGSGYAGGIVSAACDGIKIAEKIIEKYKAF